MADLFGGPGMEQTARNARHVAMIGATLGPMLLIGDLHTPSGWYNMLRIFRRTSPMSIGSYILFSFGAFSAVTAAADWMGMKRVARMAQVPAATAPPTVRPTISTLPRCRPAPSTNASALHCRTVRRGGDCHEHRRRTPSLRQSLR
ncbi:hypothetical protein [Azospirillum sp. B2RO_4]|uniref:hypothetical protein n=1 Tax=Azospirillum sp. B2RO_4 TaxID=3027796 RepID=UPI003DA976EA